MSKARPRPQNRNPGPSTATVDYRLGKLDRLGLIDGRWLDCGCGGGDYAVALVRRGASHAVGVDILADRIEFARERWGDVSDITFSVASAERLPFADETFDRVLLNKVLEHVDDENCVLREVRRVLAAGGYLAVFSPNRWFPFEGHGLLGPMRMPFPVPLVPWLPQRLVRRWLQAANYWPRELRDLVQEAEFEVVTVDFALPLLEEYKWLPPPLLRIYIRKFDLIERHRILRRFGVSTLVIARKPG